MSYITFSLILLSIFFSVAGQILLKHGMSDNEIQSALDSNAFIALRHIFTNLSVLSGLFAYGAGAIVWLFVLSRVEVSRAYPFIGLGFIGTMLFAYWFLNEPITSTKLTGTFFVVLGVFFISR